MVVIGGGSLTGETRLLNAEQCYRLKSAVLKSSFFGVINTAISHIIACSPMHETPGLRVLKAAHGHIFLLPSK